MYKINDRVKIIKTTEVSGYTKDYIGMTGTIIDVKNLPPNINLSSSINKSTSKSIVVKIDNKHIPKTKYGFSIITPRATFFTEELETINTPDDSIIIEEEIPNLINNYIPKDNEIFTVFDYIDQSVSYKGTIYTIVNNYILDCAFANEWDDEDIEEVLMLKTKQEVKDFLYSNMDSYLQ